MPLRLPGRVAAAALALTIVCPWLVAGSAQAPNAAVIGALDRYAAGDFDAAIGAPQVRRLRASDLIAGADAWVAAATVTERARRSVVAAAFAIDLVWSTTQDPSLNDVVWNDPAASPKSLKPPDRSASPIYFWSAIGPVVDWAVGTLPEVESGAAAESAWWPAAIGLLQHGKHWVQAAEMVARAEARAPNARWRLVETVARVTRDVPPPRTTGRPSVLIEEGIGVAALKHAARAIGELDALREEPAFAAEADVRAGYLEMRRRRWANAIGRFERARENPSDPFLIAAADYFAGWSYERMGRTPEAIAAYRRAHAVTPTVRNLSTLLAAQLFMTEARTEAYSILEAALNADPAPPDLVLTLERGDARFMPRYLHALREALK